MPLCFRTTTSVPQGEGFDAVNEWTLQLLRIRHLGSAEPSSASMRCWPCWSRAWGGAAAGDVIFPSGSPTSGSAS